MASENGRHRSRLPAPKPARLRERLTRSRERNPQGLERFDLGAGLWACGRGFLSRPTIYGLSASSFGGNFASGLSSGEGFALVFRPVSGGRGVPQETWAGEMFLQLSGMRIENPIEMLRIKGPRN